MPDWSQFEVIEEAPNSSTNWDSFEPVSAPAKSGVKPPDGFYVSPADKPVKELGALEGASELLNMPGRWLAGKAMVRNKGVAGPEPDVDTSIIGVGPDSVPPANSMPWLPGQPPPALTHALAKTGAGLVNFFTSPHGMTEAVAGTIAPPVMGAKWMIDMLAGASKSAPEAVEAYQRGDTQEALDKAVETGANILGIRGLAGHGEAPVLENPPIVSEQVRGGVEKPANVLEVSTVEPTTKGEPNAEGIRGDTGQPVETGQVLENGQGNRSSDLEQTPPGEPKPVGAGETQAQTEAVRPTPIDTLGTLIDDPSATVNNKHSAEAGLSAQSVADLDRIAAMRTGLEKVRDEVRAAKADGKLTPELMNRGMAAGTRIQLPREAIEAATNTGSWVEGEGSGVKTQLGERPLDWRTHPEVADWLRKNGERLGIELPEELKNEKTPRFNVNTEGGGGLLSLEGLGKIRDEVVQAGKDAFSAAKDFSSWSKVMLEKFGDKVKDHLQRVYDFVKSGFESARQDRASESNRNTSGDLAINPVTRLISDLGTHAKAAFDYIKKVGEEATQAGKMNDGRRSILNWSAKLQRSFGEAAEAQKDIQSRVKGPVRREAITNWIQAGGDNAVLRQRAAASAPELRPGYEAALNLTPEELGVANEVKQAFDALGKRGQKYGVLDNFKDNYVTQVWDLGKGAAMGSARTLKNKFRFSKARTFDSFFDGEQTGFKPKTKDISKLLPVYLHEMNQVIAARQLVEDFSRGVGKDGRPLVVPRGAGVPVDNAGSQATLVMPKAIKGDTADYKVLENQPALTGWRWASKDSAGNPVFIKSDLAVHPELVSRLRAALGKSALKEWYASEGSAMAKIPKAIVQGLDMANSATKRTMLGLLAPFHQVQEGTHAVGHRVNPFRAAEGGLIDRVTGGRLPEPLKMPKIDLVNNAAQMDAAKHGLMLLPDRASANQFMEGFKPSGLVSKIPGLGALADHYSNYLFHEYIPGLKFKTYDAILSRNQKVYASDLASGKIKPEDVKALSAQQTNAAFGHLNYADIGWNPTVQHIAQLFALAPDFLEARARFTGQSIKGLTGAKVGREQLIALGTLAISQIALAYTAAKVTGGEWDKKHPFEFTKNNRRYTMRSVPEDIARLLTDTRAFVHNRLSPIIGKGALQYASGVDWRGQKVTPWQTTKELATQPVPLTARGFLGLGNTPLSAWEQLAGAVGLKISRYSAANDVYQLAQDWKKNNSNPKLVAEYERDQKTVNADSDYKPMREALDRGDLKQARDEYEKLLKTKKRDLITQTMRDFRPFTGSLEAESKFKRSLDPEQQALYDRAKAERKALYRKFQEMKATPK